MGETPQLEDGYTRIANQILEDLATWQMSGACWRLLMVVFRKTYGFGKKKDRISLSQFEEMTGMSKAEVSRNLKKLRQMGLIKGDN